MQFKETEFKLTNSEMIKLYESGLSCAEIARRAGATHGGVHKRLKKAGVCLRKRCQHPSSIPNSKMIELYKSGESIENIARLAGFTYSSIANRLKQAGIKIIRKAYKREDLTGRIFNQLTALKMIEGSGKSRWLCQCSCGKTAIVDAGRLKSGNTKSCGCRKNLHGESHGRWRGGNYIDSNGYSILSILSKESKRAIHIPEHRVVMEKVLGRPLFHNEHIHHKNGVRNDNRIENLELKVTAHGPGITISDAIPWAVEVLRRYCPEKLASTIIDQSYQHQVM
jgi:hypothetical protein